MALVDKNIDWRSFITLSKNGLSVASYTQVREAFQELFKSIYGNDIDLSSGSADGTYVDDISLIVNNILQNFKNFYNNLNIDTASGKFLENLCALSNVHRKPSSSSTALLTVTLAEDATTDLTVTNPLFLDKAGLGWVANGTFTLKKGKSQDIVVECEKLGAVNAPIGWIYAYEGSESDEGGLTSYSIKVEQKKAAYQGTLEESDSELRARRNNSLSVNTYTVIDGLISSLLYYNGIEDVKIYNNNTISSITSSSGKTTIPSHDTMVILRRNNNIDMDDSTIGSLIYEKMTPGIATIYPSSSEPNIISHSFSYTFTDGNGNNLTLPNQIVNWGVAKGDLHPQIVITIKPFDNYYAGNSTALLIANKIVDYLNGLSLGEDINIFDLNQLIMNSDPKFRGKNTYSLSSLTIDGKTDNYKNNVDDYYQYNYPSESDIVDNISSVIITLKGN